MEQKSEDLARANDQANTDWDRTAPREEFSPKILDDHLVGFLEEGTHFEGRLFFRGHLRVGGSFHGTLETPDLLTISEGAVVTGEIRAGIVVLSGQVNATIRASHRVEMIAPAVFRGEVYTPSLKVEDGVVFEGSTRMGPASSA